MQPDRVLVGQTARRFGTLTNVDVRPRILHAALGLLAGAGVTELTQPKVSRAAGVSQSHLTYYFPTRAALLLAVAEYALESAAARFRDAMERAIRDRVEGGAGAIEGLFTDKRMVRVMLGLIVASDEDRKIKASLREFIGRVRDALRAVLGEMSLPNDDATVAALHATAVGCAVLNLARDNEQSRREVAATMRIALARLATEKGESLARKRK